MSRVSYATYGDARETPAAIDDLLPAASHEPAAAAARFATRKRAALSLLAEARPQRGRARHLGMQRHRRPRSEAARAAAPTGPANGAQAEQRPRA